MASLHCHLVSAALTNPQTQPHSLRSIQPLPARSSPARAAAGRRRGGPPQGTGTGTVSCHAHSAAFRHPYYQDNAYLSDDDLSDVQAWLAADVTSSWVDANYVSLSMTCYKLMQQQNQQALQQHFAQQQQHHEQHLHQRRQGEPHTDFSPEEGVLPHHACCAPGRDHTFLCGEDEAVAWAVAPASIKSGDHFIGTP